MDLRGGVKSKNRPDESRVWLLVKFSILYSVSYSTTKFHTFIRTYPTHINVHKAVSYLSTKFIPRHETRYKPRCVVKKPSSAKKNPPIHT
jgi:hypothetical protein